VVRDRISTRLLSWASILENNTREQAERTASMRFIFPHLAYSAEKIAPGYRPNWRLQLGTLGSGNHFTEVSLEQERAPPRTECGVARRWSSGTCPAPSTQEACRDQSLTGAADRGH
jgi:hypothetical protein